MVEIGQSFGKYTLLEKIAVGGMAEIYKAKTEGIGGFEKLLAIKRLHPKFGREHDVTQMLVDEARIAVHLTHPNIAQIFDLGCIDNQYFIAMEYIDGLDLHQVRKRVGERGGEVPAEALVFVVAEALSGLHYAHTRRDANGSELQIVHRDISPQNLMISYEGEVKVVDFGIAKAEMRAQQATQHGIIKGKFYYMSPEQAYGHHVDARTDVFAAGMVLYEILAGRNPYAGAEEYELLKAVRQAQIPALSSIRPQVDDELSKIVAKALQRDPQHRFSSARQMQMALVRYLDRRFGPYRRIELAEFVRSLDGRQPTAPQPLDEGVMDRVDYEATDASMIFEAGTPITDDADWIAGPVEEDEDNPFEDDDPTLLWVPDAPPRPDEDEENPFALSSDAPQAPSPASPEGFETNSRAPESDSTAPVEPTSLVDRVRLSRKSLIYVALGVVVVLIGGAGTYLVLDGDARDTEPIPIEAGQSTGDQSEMGAKDSVDLRLESTPIGAKVRLDGRLRGETPLRLEGLSVDQTYELILSKPGYATLETQFRPATDTERLELELREAEGVLKIATYPPEALISVDGEEIGRAPLDVAGLDRERTHKVVATLEDGRTVSRTVGWGAADERVKAIDLSFDENDDGAEAEEELSAQPEATAPSRPAAKTSPRRSGSRPSGGRRDSQKARDSKAGSLDIWGGETAAKRKPAARKREASSGGGLDVWGEAKDSKPAASSGFVAVRIRGEGKVYVDGKLVSGPTTGLKHAIEPGSHRVKVYFTRLKRYSQPKTVEVRSGETVRVFFAP